MGSVRQYTESDPLILAVAERRRSLVVQELVKSYMFHRIMSVGNVLNVYDTMEVPFYISPPQLGKWITKGDVLPDAGSAGLKAMGYLTNRYLVVPSGYDMLEMMEKEGDPSQVFDKLELQAMEVAWAMKRTMSNAIWNGTGGKQPDGLATIIEAATPATQVAVVGGVDKATAYWFRNQYVQLTANFGSIPAGSTLPAGFLAMLTLLQQCTVGTLFPSDLVTTKAIFNLVKRGMLEISSAMHLITERKTAEFGFRNFLFDGAYLAWDPACPADKMYALHLSETYDSERTGDPRDKGKLDWDLETLGKKSFLELNGSIGYCQHPRIKMRKIAPRSPYRHLQQTEWILDSFNPFVMRMSDQGVLGDNGGSKMSTWS